MPWNSLGHMSTKRRFPSVVDNGQLTHTVPIQTDNWVCVCVCVCVCGCE